MAKTFHISARVADKLKAAAEKASGTLKVGFIDSDQAMIAFWNEFGHGGRFPAPARPFFRTMVANESGKWPAMLATQLKRMRMDGKLALAQVGSKIDSDLRKSIRDTSTPPLSPTTLRLRYKFWTNPEEITFRDVVTASREARSGKPIATGTQANPLMWTKKMLEATTYKVE